MILLYRGTSFVSKVIRFFNWSTYSHASWTFGIYHAGELFGDTSEYEAWERGGVGHRDHWGNHHTKGTRVDCYELKLPLDMVEMCNLKFYLCSELGKKYDYRGVFHFLTRVKKDDPDRWFCSEYVFACLKMVGRTLLENIEACQVYPGMLAYSPELRYIGWMIVGEGDKIHPAICGDDVVEGPLT